MIKAVGIKRYFGKGEKLVKAVDDISIEIKDGEFVVFLGASGSGKSTLLHILGGLDKPTEGNVYIDGKDIYGLDDDSLTVFRRRQVGFIFQNYNLVPILKVYDNIILPIELDGLKVDKKYIDEIIDILGLKDRIDFFPTKLSGGQQQRVAIARALSTRPSIILADEPTGNLDSKKAQEVIGLLRYTAQKYNQTVIMITHNEDIAQLAHRIIRIEDGRIVEE